MKVRFKHLAAFLLACASTTAYASEGATHLLTIDSITCIRPATGMDDVSTAGIAALGAVAAGAVTVAGATACTAATAGACGVSYSAVGAAAASGGSGGKAAADFLDNTFSGDDDLIIQVNGLEVWRPPGGVISGGQTLQVGKSVSIQGDATIDLIEYDSGSDNDLLGSLLVTGGHLDSEGDTGIAMSASEGSVYEIKYSIEQGAGDQASIPQFVACGTAQCKACNVPQCIKQDSSGLDRDGDLEDLKACPAGYQHHHNEKYPQTWPAEDVYLNVCEKKAVAVASSEPEWVTESNKNMDQ